MTFVKPLSVPQSLRVHHGEAREHLYETVVCPADPAIHSNMRLYAEELILVSTEGLLGSFVTPPSLIWVLETSGSTCTVLTAEGKLQMTFESNAEAAVWAKVEIHMRESSSFMTCLCDSF